MHLFTRLPITVSGSLPVIPSADIQSLVNYEQTSYAHWIFNTGAASGLVAVNNGRTLVAQSTAPTYKEKYIEVDVTPSGKALLSDYADTATAVDTVCMVVRDPTTTAGNHVLWGNYVSPSAGGSPILSGLSPARKLFLSYSGPASNIDTGLTIPTKTDFYFVAVSRDFSGATKSVVVLVGGQAAFTRTSSAAYVPGVGQTINVGSPNYASGGASPPYNDVAEFIIFPTALDATELEAVYQRAKARCAARGVAVV